MAQQTPSPSPIRSLRILVVDDLEDAAESLALLLRRHGHEAHAAYDAETALRLAREFIPHVALLDLALPRIDGFQLALRLRQLPQMQSACLIALSGYGSESDIEATRQAGFNHHLLKPIQLSQLTPLLERAAQSFLER